MPIMTCRLIFPSNDITVINANVIVNDLDLYFPCEIFQLAILASIGWTKAYITIATRWKVWYLPSNGATATVVWYNLYLNCQGETCQFQGETCQLHTRSLDCLPLPHLLEHVDHSSHSFILREQLLKSIQIKNRLKCKVVLRIDFIVKSCKQLNY